MLALLPIKGRPSDAAFVDFLSHEMQVSDSWRTFQVRSASNMHPKWRCQSSGWVDVFLGKQDTEALDYVRERRPVVLVLESPHEHEYEPVPNQESPRPLAPLQGASGQNLRALNRGTEAAWLATHPLVLVNPVPLQCSLHHYNKGKNWRSCRDATWALLWPKFRAGFIDRLNSYNPLLIVNCCTGEHDRKPLVQAALESRKILNRTAVSRQYQVGHPASWKSATPVQAKRIHQFVRERLEELANE